MEEERKKHPPVPSNFVTLVQLQERWLEEQQRKQREKGEEEERNRRVKEEEEERDSEDQENQMRQKENGERSKTNTLSCRRPSFGKNRRNQPEKSSLTIGMIERKSEESQVGAIVVDNLKQKIDVFRKYRRNQREKSSLTIGMIERKSEESQVGAIVVDEGKRKIDVFRKNRRNQPEKSSLTIGMIERKSEESQVGAIVVGDGERKIDVFRKNRRNQPEKSSLTIGMIERKSEESQVGAIVVDDGERKIDDLNKKKKKNKKKGKWKKKVKPRAEEELSVGTEQSLPEYEEAEEKIPVVLIERDGEKEGVTTEFQRNGKNSVVNDMVWEKKAPMARSAEIGRKFEDLSLSGGKGGNERYPGNTLGGEWKYNRRRSGSFNPRRLQKSRDSNLVWVRKEDTSDVTVAGVWSSGGLVKAGESQKKPVQMRPKESSWR